MSSYIFTEKAERDLEEIIDFTVEHWGAIQAMKYIDGLEEIAQTLADSPDVGLKRDAMLEGMLSFPYDQHVLLLHKRQSWCVHHQSITCQYRFCEAY